MSINPQIDILLKRAAEISDGILRPRAEATDQADTLPFGNIRALADAGLLGFTTPTQFGGCGADGADLRKYTEILAAACGVTTFVQGQHQSAALLIAGSDNEGLKNDLLPKMATGEAMCGVAFSHLRRPGDPVLKATPINDGFEFEGEAPWLTGWGMMTDVVLAGTLDDGRFLYVVAPLGESNALSASPPMRLCAMNASGTVAVKFRGFRVSADRHLKTITREEMSRSDVEAILGVTAQPFGVARAAIALLCENGVTYRNTEFVNHASVLDAQLTALRSETEKWVSMTRDSRYKECALELRAKAIQHGVWCAHAALASSGGRGNSLLHPAQRLFREAMFYTLTAQTPDVQLATLRRIAMTESDIDQA